MLFHVVVTLQCCLGILARSPEAEVGPPYQGEDGFTEEQVVKKYRRYLANWGIYGLSRVCQICRTLTPAKHCKLMQSQGAGKPRQFACRNCREKKSNYVLPTLPSTPEALTLLNALERRLLAMAKVDQVLIDKLPAGGPSAQWGRMYVIPTEEPELCDLLEEAELGEDGVVYVKGVQGLTASVARLQYLYSGLQVLKEQHSFYKNSAAVDKALSDMGRILEQLPAVPLPEQHDGQEAEGNETEEELEVTYLTAREPTIPKADLQTLRELRRKAKHTLDNVDALLFPHLFPEGEGGYPENAKKFSEYARRRLLGQDGRFEQDPSYTMWLLEEHMKKRLSGNVNVRMKGQELPQFGSRYESSNRQVYSALRDLPGTLPYLYSKKGVAMSMYDQLGKPQFFLTLTCHCRQPNILAAVVIAKLLRDHGYAPAGAEVEEEAAKIIHQYMINENHAWEGMTANQLCNSMPAIVARQFMHGLRQMLHWLQGGDSGSKFETDNVDEQDRPEADAEAANPSGEEAAPAMDEAGRHHSLKKEKPPFKVFDYIVRIEWQKRGYPHAHILLWADVPDVAGMQRPEDAGEDVDWSDEEVRQAVVPTCAEDLSDKYIRTKSSYRWKQDAKGKDENKRSVNAKLATFMEHKCGPYCGKYTLGSCRFGFPRGPEAQTRWRTPQEQFGSRWKSSLAARRHKDDGMVGQYNEEILRFWRASMDLQVICELTCASKYILGYAFKSEEDLAAKRRIDTIMEGFLQDMGKVDLTANEVYQAAHAATQGRATSTFEAVHYLLGFPTVFFSRDNEWIQVGPPSTWTLTVPQVEEADALQDPAQYAAMRQEAGTDLPVAHRWYRYLQQNHPEEMVKVPVEKAEPVEKQWQEITFFDFVAGFRYIGKKEGEKPTPRPWPAIVAHRNFSPDIEPDNFYYSKLLLHTRWQEPGDWLQENDRGSHAAAFRRIATDTDKHPDFLNSICMPKMDGTVQAARELQAVQAVMYLKATAMDMEGYGHCQANEDNYRDSLKIMQALKDRHGDDIDFMAPDTVPTGPATDVFAPVDGGQAGGGSAVESSKLPCLHAKYLCSGGLQHNQPHTVQVTKKRD